jgi:nucleotide-binding universal stress UspA family protein
MFTRVLFPITSAAQEPQVSALVRLLAAHGPLSVTLVRAHTWMPESAALRAISAELDQLAARLRSDSVDAHYLLEFDTAERGILDAAEHTQADLIVLTPHVRRGLDALTHPSVTTKLMTSATASLLIWPERPAETGAQDFLNLPGAAVILPLDGGELAERALPYAIDLANMFGRSLLLVRVTPDVTPPMSIVAETALVTPEILRAEQEEARSYLAKVRERYANDATLPIQSMVMMGTPGLRILDLAEAHPGSVIVLCTHGRGPLSRALLGSVTTQVIREGTTPTLVIPPHAPAPLARTAPLKRPTVVVEG